ncbi:hypothetical protein [Tautonia rosea]|uniref:hypothetical protein n=1 Tax=Tautonia rosea TaxID=2728037 RepID=UPI00147309AA|nr:hypothetical protein [Tautonia rosea]
MQPPSATAKPTGVTILSRALETKGGPVPPEAARFLLSLEIRDQDKQRMLDLLQKQQEGHLTREERDELESYIQADTVLSLLRAKAILALKQAGQEP